MLILFWVCYHHVDVSDVANVLEVMLPPTFRVFLVNFCFYIAFH
jgi:hypothetical protein